MNTRALARAMAEGYAYTLIEIGAKFRYFGDGGGDPAWLNECCHCERLMSSGCLDRCPGLLARRALGVA